MNFSPLIDNILNIICANFLLCWYKTVEDKALQILERFFWNTLYMGHFTVIEPWLIKFEITYFT